MKRFVFALFSLFVTNCLFALPHSSIMNGTPITNDQQYPFVVAVYDPSNGSDADCTGTLVSSNWVLTASHCVIDEDTNKAYSPDQVTVGTGYLAAHKNKAESVLTVTEIKIYPHQGGGIAKDHDIALLHLQNPVANIKPIKIAAPNAMPNFKLGGFHTTAIGYGWLYLYDWAPICKTNPNSEDCTWYEKDGDYAYYGTQVIQTNAQANTLITAFMKKYPETGPLPIAYDPNTMTGFVSPNGHRVTNGDSGGPSVATVNGTLEQVGVHSWGMIPDYQDYTSGDFANSICIDVNTMNPDIYHFIMNTIQTH